MPQDFLIGKQSLLKVDSTRNYIQENKVKLSVDADVLRNKNYNKFDVSKDPASVFIASPAGAGIGSIEPEYLDPTSDTVIIGTQTWQTRNLNVSKYSDGTPIPQVTDPTAWQNLTTGAWCWYRNDSNYDSVYGKLYNWYAVNDPRGLAPIGFKIPAPSDFSTLNTFLGNGISGGKLKQKGSDYWTNNIGATNSAGFYGRGTGRRTTAGGFAQILAITFYWTTTGTTVATSYVLQASTTTFVPSSQALAQGFSIRCIKI